MVVSRDLSELDWWLDKQGHFRWEGGWLSLLEPLSKDESDLKIL